MPVFEYKALDKGGKSRKGIVDAESLAAARKKLKGTGFYPVSIQEGSAATKKKSDGSALHVSLFSRIKSAEVHIFTRQLATMLGAKIPLVQSLSSLVEQTANPSLKRIIAEVKEAVNEGRTLTAALAEYPKVFSPIYVNMIRAGEASGSLDIVLENLADFGERQETLRGKLTSALVYPCIMAVICTGVLIILITYIVPNITKVFVEMDRVLPLPTRILIGFSDFLKNWWLALLVLLAFAVFGLRMFLRTERGKSLKDLFALKMPIIGRVRQKTILARFAATMGSLLESGVGLIPAMEIVRTIVNNCHIGQVIDEAIEQIREGRPMTASLARSPWFPPMFVQMVGVGEQTGEQEKMLKKVADAYEREVETSITRMTALIEPLMIVVMGALVGGIILSILLPIFDMNQMVG